MRGIAVSDVEPVSIRWCLKKERHHPEEAPLAVLAEEGLSQVLAVGSGSMQFGTSPPSSTG